MRRPNIVFIMTDDHAAHAMSCYGSRINKTPYMDELAKEGMLFYNAFCTNSICSPSRAVILTGKHSHLNGVRNLSDSLDSSQMNFAKILQAEGYKTAIVGKWHLGEGKGSEPQGFDYWNVLPGQGDYHDPVMKEMGTSKKFAGYVTDIITDKSIEWLNSLEKEQPFCLLIHHKAPHRPWLPDARHKDMYINEDIPQPYTLFDDYANRSNAAKNAKMRIADDLNNTDIKVKSINGLSLVTLDDEVITFNSREEMIDWKYQRYIKDYLRCVASVDDNVGRVLEYLRENGLEDDTVAVYTSDQGFFLGDHGWFDKRFMYEESLRMPLIIKYPRMIKAGTKCEDMVTNLDFAETLLELTESPIPDEMQGLSFKKLLAGEKIPDWKTSMYYRYWTQGTNHNVPAHYGIRTMRYKLIHYYGDALDTGLKTPSSTPEWELFDLESDPYEMNNVFGDSKYAELVPRLMEELYKLKQEARDYK